MIRKSWMMGASIETTLELWASSLQPTLVSPPIELDDYRRAIDELLPAVSASLAAHRDRVEEMFLKTKAERFVPVP